MTTKPDISIKSNAFTDVYDKSGFAVGTEIIIQNKSNNEHMLIREDTAKPSDTETNGPLIGPRDYYRVPTGSDKVWVRALTNSDYISVQPSSGIVPTFATGALTLVDAESKAAMNTIFGEQVVGERRDDVSVQFQYNISSFDVFDITGDPTGTGSVVHVVNRAVIKSGTGVGAATLTSRDAVRYRPGHECVCMITTDYTAPEENTFQHHGMFNGTNGYYFGTKDLEFGVFRLDSSVETFTPQSEWSHDKLDGSGISGFDIDITKYNLFKISFGWLGISPVFFSVYAGHKLGWVLCHVSDLINTQSSPHIENPSLPVTAAVGRTSGTGASMDLSTSSWRAGVVGEAQEDNSSNRTFSETVLDLTIANGAEVPVISLRSKATFQGKTNHIRVELMVVRFVTDGSKPVAFTGFLNGSLTGDSFSDKSAANSVIEIDTSATAITGGSESAATALGKVDSERADVRGTGLVIYPGDTFTITGFRVSGTGTVTISIRWREAF